MIPFADQVTMEDIKKTDKIIEFYVGSYDNITEENKYALIDLHTDSVFRYGTYKMINERVGQGAKVYAWILTHQGKHSVSEWFGLPVDGVNHADELLYMWDPVFEQDLQFYGTLQLSLDTEQHTKAEGLRIKKKLDVSDNITKEETAQDAQCKEISDH